MSDTIELQDELATLKSRADMLGVTYHPSIGLEKLREKVNAAMAGKPEAKEEPKVAAAVEETENQRRVRLKQDAHRLVRIRLTCMNPAKKDWPGEIFTVGNGAVGTVRRFVPFNADDGWHVQHILYEMIRDRMCPTYVTVKQKNGVQVRQSRMIREFAIELLPDLTPDELAELARRQAMAKSVD